MSAAGIEHQFAREWSHYLGEEYRQPIHGYCHSEEPFPHVCHADAHEPHSGNHKECGDEESSKSEILGNEEVGNHSSQRAAVVHEDAVGIEPFAGAHAFEYALVGSAGGEV